MCPYSNTGPGRQETTQLGLVSNSLPKRWVCHFPQHTITQANALREGLGKSLLYSDTMMFRDPLRKRGLPVSWYFFKSKGISSPETERGALTFHCGDWPRPSFHLLLRSFDFIYWITSISLVLGPTSSIKHLYRPLWMKAIPTLLPSGHYIHLALES